MRRWMLLSGVVFAASCTKENPAAKCSTGTCMDPAAPFCDVDGSIGGTPGTCLGVTCTPGDFAACRGDVALTCNAMGNNYDELLCQKGCTPEAKGCRLCDAGQTVCANGEVQTCDANGAVSSSETCPLGCFGSAPRCRDVDPSNGLAQYVDMVSAPPDFDTGAQNVRVDTGTGDVQAGVTSVSLPSFRIPAPPLGVAIRVFVVHDLHVASGGYLSSIDSTATDAGYTSVALAIVATGSITIDGVIAPGPGAYHDATCVGGHGQETDDGTRFQTGASGGGGFATPGGDGAGIAGPGLGGGAAGGVSGGPTLVPLRGGCPAGGMVTDNGTLETYGTPAGGAIQLTAAGAVVINGTINVDGATGYPERASANGEAIYGGGAGGAILIEGATVTLGPSALLLARGGGGGSQDVPPTTANLDANPIPGVRCATQSVYCGNGGAGAAPGIAAQNGATAQYSSTQPALTSGGGGGGLGRIRINSQSGTYTKASSSVEAGDLTTGVVGTR